MAYLFVASMSSLQQMNICSWKNLEMICLLSLSSCEKIPILFRPLENLFQTIGLWLYWSTMILAGLGVYFSSTNRLVISEALPHFANSTHIMLLFFIAIGLKYNPNDENYCDIKALKMSIYLLSWGSEFAASYVRSLSLSLSLSCCWPRDGCHKVYVVTPT